MTTPRLIDAYPLRWPDLRPRTPYSRRREAKFEYGLGRSRDELLRELRLLAARDLVVSTNLPTRRDGLFYADARQPDDPGVAVYFDRTVGYVNQKRVSYVIACDTYRKVEWNVRAIGVTVEALRSIERHGASELLEQAFTGFAALPPATVGDPPWREVLGIRGDIGWPHTEIACTAVRAAYRELAQIHHPDKGGDVERMQQINRAFERAKQEGFA